jgi:hypothetical protein
MKRIFLLCSLGAMVCSSCLAQVAWQTDGVPVCTATGDQMNPVIVPDMKGGGIIIWQDYRVGNYDIYAQRVDSSGNCMWANNGVALAASALTESYPKAISDMRGGAIIAFNKGSYNVWAQRVDSAGNACWGTNGMDVSSLTNSVQMSYKLCSDSVGGALITWKNNDTLSSDGNDGYIQRVDSIGNLPWGATGIMVAGGPGEQRCVGGAIEDGRGGGNIMG